jgi:hypothetical protein
MSLQSYVTQMLTRSTAAPALSDWLRGLDDLPQHTSLSGSQAVREARDDLP